MAGIERISRIILNTTYLVSDRYWRPNWSRSYSLVSNRINRHSKQHPWSCTHTHNLTDTLMHCAWSKDMQLISQNIDLILHITLHFAICPLWYRSGRWTLWPQGRCPSPSSQIAWTRPLHISTGRIHTPGSPRDSRIDTRSDDQSLEPKE